MYWTYEKLDESYNVKECPMSDPDGSITGHVVLGLKQWFDENPEERIRLWWTKHIHPETKEIEYNKQMQYLVKSIRVIDEYTVEDVYHVMDKPEEMLLLEDMLDALGMLWVDDGESGITWRMGGMN